MNVVGLGVHIKGELAIIESIYYKQAVKNRCVLKRYHAMIFKISHVIRINMLGLPESKTGLIPKHGLNSSLIKIQIVS